MSKHFFFLLWVPQVLYLELNIIFYSFWTNVDDDNPKGFFL